MGLVMKIHSRFYFTGLLMLVMLFNTACGKKSDLTLPTPEEAPAQETTSFKFKFSPPPFYLRLTRFQETT
ncbi:hypothetical protein MNBD_GAMMA03-590 [hydrothermal vent metagenome]|uniref:Uncharacterized protein n=1 Tax=hydrothermal vent metagenome TaxID=652676 RepID=A0A3B0VST4_9ZZZZ